MGDLWGNQESSAEDINMKNRNWKNVWNWFRKRNCDKEDWKYSKRKLFKDYIKTYVIISYYWQKDFSLIGGVRYSQVCNQDKTENFSNYKTKILLALRIWECLFISNTEPPRRSTSIILFFRKSQNS